MTRRKSKPTKSLSTRDKILEGSKPVAEEGVGQELPGTTKESGANDKKSKSFEAKNEINNRVESSGDETKKDSSSSLKSELEKIHQQIHPFVYWAQSQSHITLRVDLLQIQDLKVAITGPGEKLSFSAKGKGAHGLQEYHFEIDFCSKVDEKFECHQIERYVLLLIKKETIGKWPRLTHDQIKLPWLRFDFDRYTGEDSDSDNNTTCDSNIGVDSSGGQTYEQLRERQRQVKAASTCSQQNQEASHQSSSSAKTFRECFDSIEKQSKSIENIGNKQNLNMKYDHRKDAMPTTTSGKNLAKQLNYKKTYLFLYNLMMFVMFLKVYIVLIIKYSNGTMDDDILQGAAFIIRMLTYTQLLETLHPILGLVPGGPFMPFLQVIGRIVVNLFLTETAIRLDSAPYAHYLFIVWSSIEIIRYPFYALRVFKVNLYLLTWCRYSLFIPLYPMGGFFESMVVLSTIKRYEKTGQYSVTLPNQANFSFNLPIFLKIYIFLLLGPSIYSLMKYMWSQRAKQLKEKED